MININIGSIVAYDSNPAKLGEVLDVFNFANGEQGVRVKPFDKSFPFYVYVSEVWVLADTI